MLKEMIFKLRTKEKMTQEQFAELFGVSRQAVQKWENGAAAPEISKLIEISNYFGISLDALVLERDNRLTEDLTYNKTMKPKFANMHDWEFYASNLSTEYTQCIEEGLDIEQYEELFNTVSKLPKNEKAITKYSLKQNMFANSYVFLCDFNGRRAMIEFEPNIQFVMILKNAIKNAKHQSENSESNDI